jgi:hypothetical protein
VAKILHSEMITYSCDINIELYKYKLNLEIIPVRKEYEKLRCNNCLCDYIDDSDNDDRYNYDDSDNDENDNDDNCDKCTEMRLINYEDHIIDSLNDKFGEINRDNVLFFENISDVPYIDNVLKNKKINISNIIKYYDSTPLLLLIHKKQYIPDYSYICQLIGSYNDRINELCEVCNICNSNDFWYRNIFHSGFCVGYICTNCDHHVKYYYKDTVLPQPYKIKTEL